MLGVISITCCYCQPMVGGLLWVRKFCNAVASLSLPCACGSVQLLWSSAQEACTHLCHCPLRVLQAAHFALCRGPACLTAAHSPLAASPLSCGRSTRGQRCPWEGDALPPQVLLGRPASHPFSYLPLLLALVKFPSSFLSL